MAEVLLGIETSCDETSAAILVGEGEHPELASLVILSQDIHAVFGGVVPELASAGYIGSAAPKRTAGSSRERAVIVSMRRTPGLFSTSCPDGMDRETR